eukprot:CAMPEP_0177634446 /NCGR_PEP_ID=MMETSP0447-20121125/3373_1 /TAXON_ID=0 /ORGANISM="Stygamoeba regulata, Strain BSH-02190019" /LENGTH=115 /DNA_ID=CAMNT_0019136169 /DNA_START=64 /DNA_END=412 /DNA_ORIENTATION=-
MSEKRLHVPPASCDAGASASAGGWVVRVRAWTDEIRSVCTLDDVLSMFRLPVGGGHGTAADVALAAACLPIPHFSQKQLLASEQVASACPLADAFSASLADAVRRPMELEPYVQE